MRRRIWFWLQCVFHDFWPDPSAFKPGEDEGEHTRDNVESLSMRLFANSARWANGGVLPEGTTWRTLDFSSREYYRRRIINMLRREDEAKSRKA